MREMTNRSGRIPPRNGSVAFIDSVGKRKGFRRTITRFAEKTSMVGVPYINRAKFWWAKLIWSILLLGAIAVMILHLWYLFDQWYSWPKQTNVELGFSALGFPQVTICNTNIMKKHRLETSNESQAWPLKKLAKDMNPENLVPDQFDSNYVPESGNSTSVRRKRFVEGYAKLNTTEYQESYTNKYKWTVEGEYAGEVDQQSLIGDMFTGLYMNLSKRARMDLGHQISDMLISCTFDEKQCNASMFELYQTSSYGNCWTISNKDFTAKQTGPKGGLSLIMFLEAGQYLKGFTTGYGVRVQIQKKGQVPFPFDEGLHAAASFETDIGMKLVSMTRLGGNYGSCNDGVEFSKKYGWEYSRRACQLDCLNTVIVNTCGCFNEKTEGNEEFALAGNSDIKPCRWEREVRCLVNITRQYMNKTITCSCHDPCREFAYTKTVSQRQWPTAEYARVLLQAVCNRDPVVCKSLREDINNTQVLNNNFLKLNIYYEDLNYNNITESPQIETQQFLSDVGGAIGLWIGLSILSLCELIQLFVELCNYGIHRIGKGRRPETERYDRRGDRSYGDSNGKNIGKSNHSRGENGCETHWREQGMSPHFDGRYGSRDFGSSDYDQYTDLGSAGGRRQGRFPHDLERDSRGDGRRHLR